MKLIDLNPRWVRAGGPGITTRDRKPVPERLGVGVSFDCPCGCGIRVYVDLQNPLDGGGPHETAAPKWTRTGTDFETLTLSPSIQRSDLYGCGWHGFVTDGDIKTV